MPHKAHFVSFESFEVTADHEEHWHLCMLFVVDLTFIDETLLVQRMDGMQQVFGWVRNVMVTTTVMFA